jgi:3-isopropylmalate/(R)-2-methylmalate dehydratase small subunit
MGNRSATIRGTCHKFGHDLHMDTDVLPHKYAYTYPFDTEKLIPHLFEEVRSGFHKTTKPGDFIVAGRNFAFGKAHPQALIAIAGLELQLLCESMPFAAYRGAISRGIVCHRACKGITELVDDGDDIEMNFATGTFVNHTRGTRADFPPVAQRLLDMMLLGGVKPMLERWRDEQAAAAAQR